MAYYIIGILGSGTLALANLLKEMDYNVLGCDIKDVILKNNIDFIVEDIRYHKPNKNYNYIYGNSFKDHFLIKLLKSLNYNVISYKEFISQLPFKTKIQVSASHGKTFTTSLLSHILASSALIGDGTSRYQSDIEFVYEGCEYQNTFLSYNPDILLFLNIDYDHVDFFKTEEDYFNSFKLMSNKSKTLICNKNMNIEHPNKYTYSLEDEDCNLYGTILEANSDYSILKLKYKDSIYTIKTPFITKYEIENLLGSILTCLLLGRNIKEIEERLNIFQRPKRRLEIIDINNNPIILDYAHHPTQLKALYEYINNKYKDKKKIIIFESHTISRSLYFKEEYKKVLSLYNKVYLYPIYVIREKDSLKKKEFYRYLNYPKYNKRKILNNLKKENVVIIFAGAGNINLEFNSFKII